MTDKKPSPPLLHQLPPPPPGKTGWPWDEECPPSPPPPPAGETWPRISIVTPSFNQGKYLEKTIRSVLLQGYPNLEYIIIDGGSTDQSVEIIKKYEPWIDYWVSEKDRGQSHAINKGFEKATGELFGWLNSDDYLLKGALYETASFYVKQPLVVGAICGQAKKIDRKGRLIFQTSISNIDRESLFLWCYGNNFLQPSCFFTKKAWDECGPLDEDIHIALDLDLWLRISEKFRFKTFDKCIAVALGHERAKTTASLHQMYVDTAFVYIKNGGINHARQLMEDRAMKFSEMEVRFKFLKKITGIDLLLKLTVFFNKQLKVFFP